MYNVSTQSVYNIAMVLRTGHSGQTKSTQKTQKVLVQWEYLRWNVILKCKEEELSAKNVASCTANTDFTHWVSVREAEEAGEAKAVQECNGGVRGWMEGQKSVIEGRRDGREVGNMGG